MIPVVLNVSRQKTNKTMTNILSIKSRDDFRRWLAANHEKEKECWIIVKRGLPIEDGKTFWYVDAVEEAMCFGWIDSTLKKLENGDTYQRFTPRRKQSIWSELNKERCRRMERLGRMTDAGRKMLPDMSANGFIILPEILEALKADTHAWEQFLTLPDLYKRVRIDNIQTKHKQQEIFRKRLHRFIINTRLGILYGQWNDNGRLITVCETKRLTIRLITPDDIPYMMALLKDPRVMYAYEGPFSDEMIQQWYNRQQERYQNDGFGLWSVFEKGSMKWIGMCGLTVQEVNKKHIVEVGYLLHYDSWHKGYATEAAKECMDYAADTLHLSEIYSIIRDTNKASAKVALRNGMKAVGYEVKYFRGIRMPHIVYRKNLH